MAWLTRSTNSMTWKPLETRPHHVSGARGDSGVDVSHKQCRHGWTQIKRKTAREGTSEPKKAKEHSQLQAKRACPTAGKELDHGPRLHVCQALRLPNTKCVCMCVTKCVYMCVTKCVCLCVTKCVCMCVTKCVNMCVTKCVCLCVTKCVCMCVTKCVCMCVTKCVC